MPKSGVFETSEENYDFLMELYNTIGTKNNDTYEEFIGTLIMRSAHEYME